MSTALDPTALARDVQQARELLEAGRPARAASAFRRLDRVVEAAADDRAEVLEVHARLLLGKAAAEFEVAGRLEDALGLLDRAGELASRAGADHLAVPIGGQRGLLMLRRGDTRAALAALDAAAVRLEAAVPHDRMTLLLNRGSLHLERGDLPAALADLEECYRLAEHHGATVLAWKSRHNLGWVEFLSGRIPRAIASLEAAEALNPHDDHPVGMLDRARVLREAGLVADADAALARAARLQRSAGAWQELGETELARAECALVRGDVTRARGLARSARRRFVRRGNRTWQRRSELLLLECSRLAADALGPRARRTALVRVAEDAETLARACRRERRPDLARAVGLLALEARLRAGGEEGRVPGPAPVVRRRDPLAVRMRTREVRALAALSLGDRRRAAAEVRRGLAELDGYQHSFGSLDLRTASAVHGSALARLGLEVALAQGSPAGVLAFVERCRAVSTRLPQLRPPDDPVSAGLLARLRQLEQEAHDAGGDPAAAERVLRLRREAAEVEREVRARAWEVEGQDGSVVAAPGAPRLRRAAADAGVVLVSFARHRGRWIATVTDGGPVRLASLAPVAEVRAAVTRVRADLDALAVPHLPEALRGAVHASLQRGLGRLEASLLAPLGLDDRPLVVSCSGDLVLLPWGLLPGRAGRPVTVTPSASGWLRDEDRTRPVAPQVVTVAGPDLRSARREAVEVAGLWSVSGSVSGSGSGAGSRSLLDADATCEQVRDALAGHDVVHVSAHGRHRADSPLFSSVRLVDGHLYAHELDPDAGLPGLVVLSACDAGLATTRPGEEILGLAQVLLQLGTQNVVAAVARVNDEVSAGLMVRLHEHASSGVGVSAALAAVQHETLESGSPAPFVSFGRSW